MHQEPQHQPQYQAVERDDEDQFPELFDADTTDRFQEQWRNIQSNFVDDPRHALAQANALVGEVINGIAQSFDRARQGLETQWEGEGEPSTEDLRICLMRYRSFFHRLLSAYRPESLS